jgi:hypothetical protein
VTNVFVAVGGSGHKTLEALLFLCAAGLGPDALEVVCVEPETENGNYRRTEQLVDQYRSLQRFFKDGGNRIGKDCRLFRTRISHFLTAGLRWSPTGDGKRGSTLAEIFRATQMRGNLDRSGELLLFNSLYRQRRNGGPDSEQETPLSGGFRGRPPIGVAALAEAAQHSDDVLFNTFKELVKGSKEGEPPRIFLAGSIFGGTGAACLPGLARLIRAQKGTMPIGAAFLLPYFRFGAVDEAELAADADAFLRQTQGALQYYAASLENLGTFDQIFLLGAPQLAVMPLATGGSAAGTNPIFGPEQKNPPLLVELFAALAACRFLRGTTQTDAVGDEAVAYKMISEPRVVWRDLPSAVPGAVVSDDSEPLSAIGQLLRFAWLFVAIYADEVSSDAVRRNAHQPWFKSWVSDEKVDLDGKTQNAVGTSKDELAGFCRKLLGWFGVIANPPQGEGGIRNAMQCEFSTANLFKTGRLDKQRYLELPSSFERSDFARLVQGGAGPALDDIFHELNGQPRRPSEHEGVRLGAFVQKLFESSFVHAST